MTLGPNNAALEPYDVSALKLSWDVKTKVCFFSILNFPTVYTIVNEGLHVLSAHFFSYQPHALQNCIDSAILHCLNGMLNARWPANATLILNKLCERWLKLLPYWLQERMPQFKLLPIWFLPYKMIFFLFALPIVPSVQEHSDYQSIVQFTFLCQSWKLVFFPLTWVTYLCRSQLYDIASCFCEWSPYFYTQW